jgi:hypothetical protein
MIIRERRAKREEFMLAVGGGFCWVAEIMSRRVLRVDYLDCGKRPCACWYI